MAEENTTPPAPAPASVPAAPTPVVVVQQPAPAQLPVPVVPVAPHAFSAADVVEPAKDIIRKASPLSISIAAVMATLIFCIAGGFWINRDVISKALDSGHELEKLRMESRFASQKAELEMASLKKAHDHCHETVDSLTKRLERAEDEIASLKEKQAVANTNQ